MFRTQIYLTKTEREKLGILVKETGQHQSALIRKAIDEFIENRLRSKKDKKVAFDAAAGIWANRKDLPDYRALRKEFDR